MSGNRYRYTLALLSFFILISIGCSGALLSSLVFEMEIKYVMMMMMISHFHSNENIFHITKIITTTIFSVRAVTNNH